ncbi:MAG: hypothetical protein K0Q62_2086 [Phenylobacterium sp.]|jgi:uncharacterized protein (TIGR02301 family)|nr:hypothetical protein [Phenylobacterium sp.]
MRPVLFFIALCIVASPASAQERTIEMREALINLTRVLGESHALRQACNGQEDQFWRGRMTRLLETEQPEPVLEEQMKDNFNAGFAETRRLYPACGETTRRAQTLAAARGREIATGLSQAKYRVAPVYPPDVPQDGAQAVAVEPAPR